MIYDIDIDGLMQDCSNSSALAMELLLSFIKPAISVLHKIGTMCKGSLRK